MGGHHEVYFDLVYTVLFHIHFGRVADDSRALGEGIHLKRYGREPHDGCRQPVFEVWLEDVRLGDLYGYIRASLV